MDKNQIEAAKTTQTLEIRISDDVTLTLAGDPVACQLIKKLVQHLQVSVKVIRPEPVELRAIAIGYGDGA